MFAMLTTQMESYKEKKNQQNIRTKYFINSIPRCCELQGKEIFLCLSFHVTFPTVLHF